jgi:cytochrome b561
MTADTAVATPRTDRYSVISVSLHWIAAISVIVLFLTHEGAKQPGTNFHVSAGALLGMLLLWRVFHRLRNGVADKTPQHFLLNLLSRVVVWAFLGAIAVVVVTGYLIAWTNGQPLDVFGFGIPSPLPSMAGLHSVVRGAHNSVGEVFVPLLLLHVLGALKHAILDRDGVLTRMFRPVAGGR